jgi:phosphohistidine phosphatase
MKTLLILRHAKSSWDDPKLADHDRPLNKRGKRDAPRMGQLLREEDLLPDLILSSTARRARKTAEAIAEASGYTGEIEFTGDFYPGDPSDYIDALQQAPDNCERVMVVGHNPGLEELLETLTGESDHLATAALAQVSLPIQHWRELDDETGGKLLNMWRVKQLD